MIVDLCVVQITPSCTAPMEAVSEVCDWLRQVKESTQSPSDQSVGKLVY